MRTGEVTGMKQTRTRALFATFFKIGAFTFGGGYAMVALLEHEFVEKKQWVTREEFLDMVAIAESTPGPMAVNSATYIGYKLEGVPGAAASTLAVCLPSFAVIYAISLFFDQFLQLSVVSSAFRGIQVCVVYLVLSAGLKMLKNLKKDAFSRAAYDYRGKYLFEVNGRYDGTSRFPRGKRYGFFPSFSAAYRISEEPFFEPLRKAVDNLKIRLSYGSLGNQQIGYYDFIQTVTTKGSMSDYSFDGTTLGQHATVSDPVSGNQTWEKVVSKNLGLDLNMFCNRLSLTADFYIRDTKGILGKGKSLPSIYGADEPQVNSNNLRTKGYELVLGWRDSFELAGSAFSYGITGSFSDYTAKYTKCDNPSGLIGDPYVGKKYGEIWGYKVDGLFRTDEEAAEYASRIDLSTVAAGYYSATGAYGKGVRAGDIKYLDLNGDNIVNGGKGTLEDPGDRRVIGNSSPRYQYGATLNFSWYGFDVSVFVQGIGRLDWYPGADNLRFWGPYCRPYATFIPKNFMSRVWSEENTDAYFPRARAYTSLNSTQGTAYYTNDRYLQNLAYCRLKNLTIGYTIPRRLTSKVGIKECRIYFSGENLATWSALKSDFLDPEQAAADSDKKANVYPWCKTYSIGLNLTF